MRTVSHAMTCLLRSQELGAPQLLFAVSANPHCQMLNMLGCNLPCSGETACTGADLAGKAPREQRGGALELDAADSAADALLAASAASARARTAAQL